MAKRAPSERNSSPSKSPMVPPRNFLFRKARSAVIKTTRLKATVKIAKIVSGFNLWFTPAV